MNNFGRLGTLAIALLIGGALACGKEKASDELTLLGVASMAAAASSCAGGSPEVQMVNSTSRASNIYIFYPQTSCTGTALATTSAVAAGGTGAFVCVAGTSVGIKDQNGSGTCMSLTLFSGSKQTATHTLNGSTDQYNVVKASAILGFGGI